MKLLIQSIFPKKTKNVPTFIESITSEVQHHDWIGYAGYSEKKYLRYTLEKRYFQSDLVDYQSLSPDQIIATESVIIETFHKCSRHLNPTHSPTYFFVLPWFPNEETRKVFNGVMGWVDYQDTINIYLAHKHNTQELRETIAHEYNHAVWYHHHGDKQQTLFDSMIIEGLAEHFREQTVGGEIAPWCNALNEKECKLILNQLKPYLDKTDMYESVFFGNEQYKKWTGYSIGYWLIGQYLKKQKSVDWNEIMKWDTKHWKNLVLKKGTI